MLEINGSASHGGGSIVRLAAGFSVLKQIPIKITNIRAGRPNPGLQEQHVSSLRAVASICNGKLIGDEINSMEVEFYPGPIERNYADIRISTAGSVGLALQPILIAAASARYPIRLNIIGGGTCVKWSPPVFFLENITFALLSKMGYDVRIYVDRHGFYPRGGARASVEIKPPENLLPLKLSETGRIMSVNGISAASLDLEYAKVAERQMTACQNSLERYFEDFKINVIIKKEYFSTDSPGSCLTAWIETENTVLGADMIGEPGIRADIIGKKVAEELIRLHESGATLDELTVDQLIPFLAMTEGFSITVPQITEHIKTSMLLSEKFIGKKFTVEKKENLVEISG